MKKYLAEYKQKGKSFFIPVMVDEDGAIVLNCNEPAPEPEEENGLTESEKAAAWFEQEAQIQRWHDERSFPYNEHSQFK